MPTSLNDIVLNHGAARGAAADYNAGEALTLGGLTQDEFMALNPTLSYNEALAAAAAVVTENVLLGADNIVLGADNIVLTY